MLRPKLSEDCGDIPFQTETDSGPKFIMVDLDGEELVCRAEVCDVIFLQDFALHLGHGFRSSLQIYHGNIDYIQKYQNTVSAVIEVGSG